MVILAVGSGAVATSGGLRIINITWKTSFGSPISSSTIVKLKHNLVASRGKMIFFVSAGKSEPTVRDEEKGENYKDS